MVEIEKYGLIHLYNTRNHKEEEFIPLHKDKVGFYTCGPTVYNYAHIGNLKAYIMEDLLRRVLEYNGYSVKHVMNITDVGHLTSDADSGEDKLEIAAEKENKTALEIAKFYEKAFFEDLKKLNILTPTIVARATEHIDDMISLVKILEEKGFTYKTEDGIYFDTSKYSDYGVLSSKKNIKPGARVSLGEKKNPTDFALWKFSPLDKKRQMEWDSPWGKGFPGWHIECSAMSSKYLGEQYDIHAGGEDHIGVHHENEIAQSECAFGKKPWVKYWFHVFFLTLKGEKMSKSSGQFYTLSELEELGYSSLDFRYFCINSYYRRQQSFSLNALESSKKTLSRLYDSILVLLSDNFSSSLENNFKERFFLAVNKDLQMPEAISIMWEMLSSKLGNKEKYELLMEFDKILGLNLDKIELIAPNPEIKELLEKRNEFRKSKNFAEADKIRDLIEEKGFLILDSSKGAILKKK